MSVRLWAESKDLRCWLNPPRLAHHDCCLIPQSNQTLFRELGAVQLESSSFSKGCSGALQARGSARAPAPRRHGSGQQLCQAAELCWHGQGDRQRPRNPQAVVHAAREGRTVCGRNGWSTAEPNQLGGRESGQTWADRLAALAQGNAAQGWSPFQGGGRRRVGDAWPREGPGPSPHEV